MPDPHAELIALLDNAGRMNKMLTDEYRAWNAKRNTFLSSLRSGEIVCVDKAMLSAAREARASDATPSPSLNPTPPGRA